MKYQVVVQMRDGSEESFPEIDDVMLSSFEYLDPRPVRLEVKGDNRTVTTKLDNWRQITITALDTES